MSFSQSIIVHQATFYIVLSTYLWHVWARIVLFMRDCYHSISSIAMKLRLMMEGTLVDQMCCHGSISNTYISAVPISSTFLVLLLMVVVFKCGRLNWNLQWPQHWCGLFWFYKNAMCNTIYGVIHVLSKPVFNILHILFYLYIYYVHMDMSFSITYHMTRTTL